MYVGGKYENLILFVGLIALALGLLWVGQDWVMLMA